MIKLKDILNEEDVFGNTTTSTDMPDLDDAFADLEKDIKKSDLEAPESEAPLLLTLGGIALSLPEMISLIGKFVNLLKKIPGLKKLSGDKLIALGDKYHHKITNAFVFALKKAGVKDPVKAKKWANIVHHVIIALLLIAGGISMSGLMSKGQIQNATLKAAMNAVKAKELRTFLVQQAAALA